MTNFLKLNIDTSRVFGLDILRMFAIFFVMSCHALEYVPKVLLPYYKIISYDGVGIFFVLSGFLIGGILIKQIEMYDFNVKFLFSFWIKRWSRTLPNYFLFLTFLIALETLTNPKFESKTVLKYFFFCQNLIVGPDVFFSHSWSLSVEEWFYIIVPLLLFMFVKLGKIKIRIAFLLVIFLIITVVSILRYKHFLESPLLVYEMKFSVLYRLDGIMYGVLAAYIHFYFSNVWTRFKRLSLGFGIVFFAISYFFNLIDGIHFPFSTTSISIFLFLPYLNDIKTSRSKLYKIITYISLISYSLYLVNLVISKLLEEYLRIERFIKLLDNEFIQNHLWGIAFSFNFIMFWVISIFLSIIIYKYFEVPSTRLIRQRINLKLDKKST